MSEQQRGQVRKWGHIQSNIATHGAHATPHKIEAQKAPVSKLLPDGSPFRRLVEHETSTLRDGGDPSTQVSVVTNVHHPIQHNR